VPTGLSEYLKRCKPLGLCFFKCCEPLGLCFFKRCKPSVSPLGLCELFNNPIPLVFVNYSNDLNPLNLETLWKIPLTWTSSTPGIFPSSPQTTRIIPMSHTLWISCLIPTSQSLWTSWKFPKTQTLWISMMQLPIMVIGNIKSPMHVDNFYIFQLLGRE